MVSRIIEVTAVLVGMFLVLTNADSFGKAATATGNVYVGAVKTLQGR